MSGTSKTDGRGGHASSDSTDKKKNRKERSGTVGRALRSVYDETLREDVPSDFLDLLRKLD